MGLSVLTVTGKDRPGIIGQVTGLLFRSGANLEDISMTILENQLAMVMIVNTKNKSSETACRKSLGKFSKSGLSVNWKSLPGKTSAVRKHSKGSRTYILSAAGRDRTGIVFKISSFFAGLHLNITDLNSKILPQTSGGLYVLILEVDVPAGFSQKKIEKGLSALRKDLQIDIQWRPMESLEL